jgi:hypothetical protein
MDRYECGCCGRLIDSDGDPIPNTEFDRPGVECTDPIVMCNECAPRVFGEDDDA